MKKYLKGELYKICHSKFNFLLIFIIMAYSIFANILFKSNIEILYKNFSDEYLLLFVVINILFSINLIFEDINSDTIKYLLDRNYFISKIFISLLFVFVTYIISIIICYFISLVLGHSTSLFILDNLLYFIKYLPELIILILVCYGISYLTHKMIYSIIFSYLFYISSSYLEAFKIKYKRYVLISYHWNLNACENIWISIFIVSIYIFLLIISIIFIIQKKEYKN